MSVRTFLFIGLVIISLSTYGQGLSVKDSTVNLFTIGVQYGVQLPASDLADRFGYCNAVGAAARYKLRNGLDFGLEYDFQFGNRVRENNILDDLKNQDGLIINTNGQIANILLFHRGHAVRGTIGYLWPVIGPNPNSGIVFRLGAGYWTHKIRIENNQDPIPLIEGAYKKGRDRLAGGFILSQFIGFHHIHNNRLLNFYAGISAWQGFLVPLRSYQHDLMGPETSVNRLDMNFGLTAGWLIPIYKRAPKDIYY